MAKMNILFLDTDILIGILHKKIDLDSLKNSFSSYDQLATTSANVYEVYFGFYKLKYSKTKVSKLTIKKEKQAQKELFSSLIIFDMNYQASIKGAEIYHQLTSKVEKIDSFDCLIASIVLNSGFNNLLTKNIKHFGKIEGLNICSL